MIHVVSTRQRTEFEKSLIEALKSDNVVKEISNAIINSISRCFAEKFNAFETKIITLEAEIELLKTSAEKANNNCDNTFREEMEKKVDVLEQKLKNNNIRLIGVKETQHEDVLTQVKNIFTDKLNISIVDEISSVYRVGKKDKEKFRHIVVTFRDVNFKNIVYGRKKLLKGTRIVIKEDLTHLRSKLVRESSERYGFNNVWTSSGAVFIRSGSNVEKLIPGV